MSNLVAGLGLSPEQQEELRLLRSEIGDWGRQDDQLQSDRTLAVLSPQQRAQLREELFGPDWPLSRSQLIIEVGGEGGRIYLPAWDVHPDFTREELRKELGLSPQQQDRVREILGGAADLAEKLVEEWRRLPLAERKKMERPAVSKGVGGSAGSFRSDEERRKWVAQWDEMEKKARQEWWADRQQDPIAKASAELARQFEAILSPEQLARYKDMVFRSHLGAALMDRIMLAKIGATQQQIEALQRLFGESVERYHQFTREMGGKMLKVLTRAQQENLRRDIEQPESAARAAPAGKTDGKGPAVLSLSGSGALSISGAANVVVGSAGGQFTPTSAGGTDKQDGEKAAKATTPAGDNQVLPYAAIPDSFVLPVYTALGEFMFLGRKELGLSAEQKKRLYEISRDFQPEFQKTYKEVGNLPPKERRTQLQEKLGQYRNDLRKKVEEVLTPQQVEAYKKIAFPGIAYQMLYNPGYTTLYRPEAFQSIGITREQTEKQRELRKEWSRQTAQKYQESADRSLAVLSQQQRKTLLAEVEEQYRQAHEPPPEGPGVSVGVWFSDVEDAEEGGAADTDSMVLPVYENLGEANVRKTLGLSAAQEKQLQEIAAKCQAETKKLKQERQQLPADERQRKGFEFYRKSKQIAKEVRPQIEALLTPQQLAALKDIVLDPWALGSLGAPYVQEKLGLGDQQKADLAGIHKDAAEWTQRGFQEMTEKLLSVLTSEQQKKLREEVDRRGW